MPTQKGVLSFKAQKKVRKVQENHIKMKKDENSHDWWCPA